MKLFSFLLMGFISFHIGLHQSSYAQQLTRSPYSRYGIGEVLTSNTARNAAMGGIGIASDNYFTVNRLNPASYGDLIFTVMDISAFGQYSTLRTDTEEEDEISAGFQHIFFGFPANRNLAFAFGFAPYSVVGYDINTQFEIPYADTLQTASVNYLGDGGVNQAFVGVATKVWNQRVRLGANLAYSFGNTRYRRLSFVENDFVSDINTLSINFSEEVFVGGFSGQLGVIYLDTLAKPQNRPNILLRIGATADYNFDLTGTRERILNGQSTISFVTDTLVNSDGLISLPTKYGLGVNIGQYGRWTLGADFTYQDWDSFSYFGETPDLSREIQVGVGGEWIPNIESFNYFSRINYRAGFFYKSSYIQFNNEPIPDLGFTFGFALPSAPDAMDRLNPGRTTSQIHFSFTLGRRGALNSELPLEELYARVRLGVTLNDVWFRRRTVD